jgi:tetratricopeptide (TPR) repeat protein
MAALFMGLVGPAAQAAKPEAKPEKQAQDKASTEATVEQDIQARPAPLVQRLLDDPLTGDREKQRLRVFHGQWQGLGELPPRLAAQRALQRYELDSDILRHDEVPARLKARAALRRGAPKRALDLLNGATSPRDRWLRARAHQQLGQRGQAVKVLTPLRDTLLAHKIKTAPALTAGAQGLALLARLEGRPAADYHLVMRLLGKAHQQLDPLYWPAHLAEAELLLAKDNRREAMKAIKAALKLNPKCSRAWFLLGKMAAAHFNFEGAEKASTQLKKINDQHPLAARVEARMALTQRKPDRARAALAPALERWPEHRAAVALKAAVEGLAYDQPAMQRAFDRFEALAPGSALAHVTAGSFLSTARQYDIAERVLREAVSRAPNWPRPRIELGLLLMQMGKLEGARSALQRATNLDPFQVQANNQLKLAKELLAYETVETEHFIIRYKDGPDAVLARDMPEQLERMYDEVTAALKHEPKRKTQIDLMPSDRHFAVRITGMPDIWTIAAATGPVVGLTPPKSGRHQRGAFNWANVLRHEFVHTVTLDRTANRLPHWFTEGVAVSLETTGRSYSDCKLLASTLQNNDLFALDEINWGFIRPKTPRDRPLAYAQSAWIIEYLTETHGAESVLELMRLYNEGLGNIAAMKEVTGSDVDVFFSRFKQWAHQQVRVWGLHERKAQHSLRPAGDGYYQPIARLLDRWAREARLSPDALKQRAQRLMARLGTEPMQAADAEAADTQPQHAALKHITVTPAQARAAVRRYALARPVDPWADRALARLALAGDNPESAIGPLQRLNKRANRTGGWAYQLAKLHRAAGRFGGALLAIEAALDREPYNARYRELAATIALQHSDPRRALHHLKAMPALEPKAAIHHIRLAALHARLNQSEKAAKHAEKARQLNPDAPVRRFLE